MIIKYSGELVAIIPVSFDSSEGETVTYNELYIVIENDEGDKEMLKFNSKLPIKDDLLGTVDLEVNFDSSGRNKPKLTAIHK